MHNDKPFLVVGLIDSASLFETDEGGWERYEEKYAQIKGVDGSIEFITLTENTTQFSEKKSIIKALPRQPWRKNVK